jgi:hypothetical protein
MKDISIIAIKKNARHLLLFALLVIQLVVPVRLFAQADSSKAPVAVH